jgi:hypothetical protein
VNGRVEPFGDRSSQADANGMAKCAIDCLEHEVFHHRRVAG